MPERVVCMQARLPGSSCMSTCFSCPFVSSRPLRLKDEAAAVENDGGVGGEGLEIHKGPVTRRTKPIK